MCRSDVVDLVSLGEYSRMRSAEIRCILTCMSAVRLCVTIQPPQLRDGNASPDERTSWSMSQPAD